MNRRTYICEQTRVNASRVQLLQRTFNLITLYRLPGTSNVARLSSTLTEIYKMKNKIENSVLFTLNNKR